MSAVQTVAPRPNGRLFVVAALGAVTAGAVLVPLNTRYKGEEAGWILAKSGARLLVTADGFLGNDYAAMARAAGLPSLREVGRAFVVPRPGATVTEEEIIAFCRQRLANYKVPRSVRVVAALPRNASGKVLKFSLRD